MGGSPPKKLKNIILICNNDSYQLLTVLMDKFPEDLTLNALQEKELKYISVYREKIYNAFQQTNYAYIKLYIYDDHFTEYVHQVIKSELATRNLTTELVRQEDPTGISKFRQMLMIKPCQL